ncbi:MAG: hypothetical protein ABR553_08440 [Gammaproteobacteria bacterium]
MNAIKTSATLALTAALGTSTIALAGGNPFAMQPLEQGYQLAEADAAAPAAKMKDGKCGEGKCGAKSEAKTKAKDGKCGEGKCGAKSEAKAKDGKCGEGKCGAKPEAKAKDGKCGEGKCGAKK